MSLSSVLGRHLLKNNKPLVNKIASRSLSALSQKCVAHHRSGVRFQSEYRRGPYEEENEESNAFGFPLPWFTAGVLGAWFVLDLNHDSRPAALISKRVPEEEHAALAEFHSQSQPSSSSSSSSSFSSSSSSSSSPTKGGPYFNEVILSSIGEEKQEKQNQQIIPLKEEKKEKVQVVVGGEVEGKEELFPLDAMFPGKLSGESKEKFVNLNGSPRKIQRWLQGGEHYVELSTDPATKLPVLLRVHAHSGESTALFDTLKIEEALTKITDKETAGKLIKEGTLSFSPDEQAVLVEHASGLYYFSLSGSHTIQLLKNEKTTPSVVTFSPDGSHIAYIKNNDLYINRVADGVESRLTWGGNDNLFNGILDWVYQEEIYGRGNFQGYWWSPNSKHISLIQLDETPVPSYTVINDKPQHGESEITRYPKAGDANPFVKLGVVAVDGEQAKEDNQHIKWINLNKYQPKDLLITSVGWTPDSTNVVFQAQNKEQTWLDLNVASATSGEGKVLFTEKTPAWIESGGAPVWLDEGKSFLWLSEKSGHKHIYHFNADGSLIRQVTGADEKDNEWDVREFHGIDKKSGQIFFTANKSNPIGRSVYSIKLDGSELTARSPAHGSHRAMFNDDCTLFIDTVSDVKTPHTIHLYQATGKLVRDVDVESSKKVLKELEKYPALSKPEFLKVKTKDGFEMEAMIIKPPNFDASEKYPVVMHIYGGPNHPRVMDEWLGNSNLWHQYLTQKGFIVWMCDNRTASGKGIKYTWPLHRNFAELELRDIEDSLTWLKSNPWVDGEAIGLWGWSYGGYMTAYALTHSKTFKAGLAGAPVTDWSLYDTVYTERYMGTPQTNPEGYAKSSVLNSAKDLHGKLLIVHGTMDDNVHMQQTIQLLEKLQQARKQFELMLYPGARHGISDPEGVRHFRELMEKFFVENLVKKEK